MRLQCPKCGNTNGWRNATQDSNGQSATCAACGEHVTSTGGVRMETVSGDMTQNKPSKRKK